MDMLISLFQWAITLIGLITVALVGLRAMSNQDSPIISLLQPIQTIAMKVAGVGLVGYVILLTYRLSGGALTIQNIGMYIACVGILVSLLKDMSVKGSLLGDVQAVMMHKAEKLQASLAQQAEEARKAKAAPQVADNATPLGFQRREG
jgi:hypothetical protein